ncbi:hypothetical protein JCM11641_000559 [Rhodosporidiobolus odoratus]
MADFLFRAGPPPPRSLQSPETQPPPGPGSRYLPPSQARAQPSPNYLTQHTPYHDNTQQPQQYPYHQPQPQCHYAPPSPSSPHRSPDLSYDPDTIKCSSCGEGVRLDDLGDHVCRPQQEDSRARPINLNELRVDVQAAGPPRSLQQPGGYGAGMPMRHLEATPPHTPGSIQSNPSRPVSPATSEQMSRSVGSNHSQSSSSSSRLPFFERYQKQYGSGGGPSGNMAGVGVGTTSMSRSAALDNMAPSYRGGGSPSPRLAAAGFPFAPTRSPTAPFPASSSAPSLSVPAYHRQDSAPPDFPQSYPAPPLNRARQPSPGPPFQRNDRSDSRDSDFLASSSAASPSVAAFTHQRQDTPESSIHSSSPPRSRNISFSDRAAPTPPPTQPLPQPPSRTPSQTSSNSSNYLPYHRRETIKPSQSTPVDLSSYAAKRKNSASGSGSNALDACLEDLRLLSGEGDPDEVDGAQSMLDDFFAGKKTDSYGHSGVGGTEHDPLATPKATRMPTSRSTPALAGGVNARTALPASGSVPASLSSTTSSSRVKPAKSCTTCSRPLPSSHDVQLSGDGQPFCRPCFADRFLPKCRKCRKAIEGGAVTSSDGKVVGKYHRECFACFECGEGFAAGEFYVFDGKPYCQQHYHFLNGSLCANGSCGKPIEGSCVSLVGEENGGGGRYHPPCFQCSEPSCVVPLLVHHFVVDRLPYCELHAAGPIRRRPQKGGQEEGQARAKKRMTIITRR